MEKKSVEAQFFTQAQEKAEMSVLIETYGSLLTDRQRYIVTSSCDYDVSLSEMSEVLGISRQAVRDALMRAEELLREYEEKLGFTKRLREINRIARLREGGESNALRAIEELSEL